MDKNTKILKSYYACVKCDQVPTENYVYTCADGHNMCASCYQKSVVKRCICGCTLIRRRLTVEDNIQFRPISAPVGLEKRVPSSCPSPLNCNGEGEVLTEMLFTNVNMEEGGSHENVDEQYKRQLDRKESGRVRPNSKYPIRKDRIQSSSCMHVSKRPIDCPSSGCNKIITLSSLVLHFSFDHPKIPQTYIDLDETKILTMNLGDLISGKSSCIALLLINQDINSHISLNPHSLTSDIALPLLAAKIPCRTQRNFQKIEYYEYNEEALHTIHEKSPKDFEMVIIWLCGLSDNLNCIIEVSNNAKGLSYSYSGPTGSLRVDNDPYSVFSKADCLIIHTTSLEKIAYEDDDKNACDVKVMLIKRN